MESEKVLLTLTTLAALNTFGRAGLGALLDDVATLATILASKAVNTRNGACTS